MVATTILLLALSGVGVNSPAQWQATMCMTGRYQRPRYYASACSVEPLADASFCLPFNTKFAVVTAPQESEAKCIDVVNQNANRSGLVCIDVEGPMPLACK